MAGRPGAPPDGRVSDEQAADLPVGWRGAAPAVALWPGDPAAPPLPAWLGGVMPGGGGGKSGSLWLRLWASRPTLARVRTASTPEQRRPRQALKHVFKTGDHLLLGPSLLWLWLPLLGDEVAGHRGRCRRLQLLLLHLSTSTSLMTGVILVIVKWIRVTLQTMMSGLQELWHL